MEPDLYNIKAFKDDINARFEQATLWTPVNVLGVIIFVIGMALFIDVAIVSPHAKLFDSKEGILSTILIAIGGLLTSWKYILFTWYRTGKEYQFLGSMSRSKKYAWIPFVVVSVVIMLLVFIAW